MIANTPRKENIFLLDIENERERRNIERERKKREREEGEKKEGKGEIERERGIFSKKLVKYPLTNK